MSDEELEPEDSTKATLEMNRDEVDAILARARAQADEEDEDGAREDPADDEEE